MLDFQYSSIIIYHLHQGDDNLFLQTTIFLQKLQRSARTEDLYALKILLIQIIII